MTIQELVQESRKAELELRKQLIRLYGHNGKIVKGIKKDVEFKQAEKAFKVAAKALQEATNNK